MTIDKTNNFHIITFYTDNWLYKKYAMEMKSKCDSLKIPSHIKHRETLGDYFRNVSMKPKFILESLEELKTPVLWIDADALLLRSPIFFEHLNVNFAARKMPKDRSNTWHVGTMYFDYKPNVVELVRRWNALTNEKCSDEKALDILWKRGDFIDLEIISSDIPPEYFHIIHKHNEIPKNKDLVICHRLSTDASKMWHKSRAKQKK